MSRHERFDGGRVGADCQDADTRRRHLGSEKGAIGLRDFVLERHSDARTDRHSTPPSGGRTVLAALFLRGSDLSEALEFLASDLLGREAYARADVLTISDFELEPLSAAAREAIGRAKRTSGTRFFGLLTGAYEGGMYFCDHRWRYMRGRLAPIR